MKKFAIVSKDDAVSIKVATTIQQQLLQAGLPYSEKEPDVVCVIGGDGTFLSAIHKYLYRLDQTVFTGVHTGTLGFFVDYTLKELKECIEDIATKEPTIENKRLLKVTLADGRSYYAVNEIRVESYKTKAIDVYINGNMLESFHGNGLSLSTKVGSTAYNRSLNGAVIEPGLDIMELCEIAGIHHAHYRSLINPLIVAGNTTLKFVSKDYNDAHLCFDRFDINLSGENEITCILDNKCVQLAHYKNIEWAQHLKQLF